MKKLHFIRPLACLLALALLLSACLLPAAAEDDTLYTYWFSTDSLNTVTAQFPDGDTKTYSPVTNLSARVRVFCREQFSYAENFRAGGELYSVVSPAYKSDFIMLDDGVGYVYPHDNIHMATKEGQTLLAALGKGQSIDSYRIHASDSYYAYFDETLLGALRIAPAGQAVSYTLFELKDLQRYEIFGLLADNAWYGYLEGYVFETEDGLFYASARSLPDSCFGEDAELLPKTTERMLLIPLDEELSEEVYGRILHLENHYNTYRSEDDESSDIFDYDETVRGLTLATVIILGIVCPIAPVTLGLCLPHARNLGKKKRWYVLTAAGGVWLAMGILLLVLMCTVM
jgi:hypothetical protein